MSEMNQVNGPVGGVDAAPKPAPGPGRRRLRFDPRADAWKILVVLGVLLAANLGFTLFVLRPQSKAVSLLEEEKETFDETYRAAEKGAEEVRASYERAIRIRDDLHEFYENMLGSARTRGAQVQREIWTIGKRFNTVPDPLNLSPKDLDDQGVQQLTISFPLDGGYENLRRFVEALERSDQLLIIDRINLAENRAEGGGLRLSIDVSTYFNAPHLREFKSKLKGRTSQRERRG